MCTDPSVISPSGPIAAAVVGGCVFGAMWPWPVLLSFICAKPVTPHAPTRPPTRTIRFMLASKSSARRSGVDYTEESKRGATVQWLGWPVLSLGDDDVAAEGSDDDGRAAVAERGAHGMAVGPVAA